MNVCEDGVNMCTQGAGAGAGCAVNGSCVHRNRRRIWLRRGCKVLSLALAVLILMSLAWNLLYIHRNYDEDRIIGFFNEPDDSLDVVLIGASDISRAYSSGLAYKDYGITSYPFTINGDAVQVWQAQLDEAMRRQSPDAVVIEVNGALYSASEEKDFHMHQTAVERMALHLPLLSPIRLQLIEEYLTSTKDWSSALRLLLPIYEYHSHQPGGIGSALATVWDNLHFGTDNEGVSTLRGLETITGPAVQCDLVPDIEKSNETEDLDPVYEKALRRFLAHCKKKYPSTNFIFVRTPHLFAKGDERMLRIYRRTNRIAEIFDEYGYTFLNFEKLKAEVGIDETTDFYDTNHLNVSGMRKFTRYFSEYLLDHGVTASGGNLAEKTRRQWEHTARYTDLFLRYYDRLQAEGVVNKDLFECSEVLGVLREMDAEDAV